MVQLWPPCHQRLDCWNEDGWLRPHQLLDSIGPCFKALYRFLNCVVIGRRIIRWIVRRCNKNISFYSRSEHILIFIWLAMHWLAVASRPGLAMHWLAVASRPGLAMHWLAVASRPGLAMHWLAVASQPGIAMHWLAVASRPGLAMHWLAVASRPALAMHWLAVASRPGLAMHWLAVASRPGLAMHWLAVASRPGLKQTIEPSCLFGRYLIEYIALQREMWIKSALFLRKHINSTCKLFYVHMNYIDSAFIWVS